ncbi:MAG: amidohydrolase family protein [Solirubrobacterales bacterium]
MSVAAIVEGELAALGAEGIRLFDVHSHTGADIDGSTRSAEEHLDDLAPLRGRSVIFPFCVSGSYEDENLRVIEEGRRHPEELVPFARLDPKSISPADAAQALDAGAKGFKLHPRAEGFRLDHPGVAAILAAAAAARAPVLIHAGGGVGSFGLAITELADRHGDCPIVLAHAAVSDLVWLGEVAADHPNLYFDTAWWNPSDLLALFALVPPGQILFGSDEPYMKLEVVLAIVLRCARSAGLSEEAIALVLGGQLAALLEGDAPADAGPALGRASFTMPTLEGRLAILLAAAGGCMLGGGDPTQILELAQLAVGEGEDADRVSALIDEARTGSPQAPWAIAMALTLVVTPGTGSAAAQACSTTLAV